MYRSQPSADDPNQPEPSDFPRFFRHFLPIVARWVRRLGGSLIDVDDVVQDVFVVALRHSSRFDPELGVPEAWLRGITVRTVLDHKRRAFTRNRWVRFFSFFESDNVRSNEPDPETSAQWSEQTRNLYAALDQLKEPYRTTFVLYELEELSGDEVASLTDTAVATVWVRLFRARKKLEAALRDMEAKS